MSKRLVALALLAGLGGVAAMQAGEVREFLLGNTVRALSESPPEVRVIYSAMRFNDAAEEWNVDLIVTNTGSQTFSGQMAVSIESFSGTTGPLRPDGFALTSPGNPFFRLTLLNWQQNPLAPGTATPRRTISLGFIEGPPPHLTTKIFVQPFAAAYALALTRTLDGLGQPLPGARVIEKGPKGERILFSDSEYGVITLGQDAAEHTWQFDHPGHLPVWRQLALAANEVRLVPNPRLVLRSSSIVSLESATPGVISDAGTNILINVSAANFVGDTDATLTPVDGQTLPGLLPQGWSPLNAFWLELNHEPVQPLQTELRPAAEIRPSETAVLLRWNETSMQWLVLATSPGGGSNAVAVVLPSSGAYALVVADSSSLVPTPMVGQALRGRSGQLPVASALAASGTVNPVTSVASLLSEEVTAFASLTVTSRTLLPASGLLLRCDVRESYTLQDGSSRFVPQYETFLIGYQRPGDANPNTVHASFPMRPVLLFSSDELSEAKLIADVLPPGTFTGGVFETNGTTLEFESIRLIAAAGTFEGHQAALFRRVPPRNFDGLFGRGLTIEAAFDLTVAAAEPGRRISLQLSNAPNQHFILARVLSDRRLVGLEPIERLISGTNGTVSSAEPASGQRLPGMTKAGQYLVLRVGTQLGLISGVVRDGLGQPIAGAPVGITGQPWLALSGSDGTYQILAPTGAVQIATIDPANHNADFVELTIGDPATPVQVDLSSTERGPRVINVSPAHGATRVPRVSPIVITFSKPVNPGTAAAGGIQLLNSNNQPVSVTVSLNLRNTTVTLLTSEPLAFAAPYTIRLAQTIADLSGRALEGAAEFTFTTENAQLERGNVQLIIFQPGATNLPADVRANLIGFVPGNDPHAVVVKGTPGAAEPEQPVILVNESSGETATTLSKADGSFYGFIRGGEEDYVSAVLVNANGTRNYLPVSRQQFDNGFIGLYKQGGILEASNEDRRLEVIVEPGAIDAREKLRLRQISLTELLPLLNNTQPEGGRLLGAFRYEEAGDGLKVAADVKVDVSVDELGLPAGSDPAQGGYLLTIPRKYDDNVVYEIIDTMQFESTGAGRGQLVTRSPPYFGLLLRKLSALQKNTLRQNALGSLTLGSSTDSEGGAKNEGTFAFLTLEELGVTTINGRVISATLDAAGRPVSSIEPVAGAVVSVDFGLLGSLPFGNFRAGELVATSDLDGHFAFGLKPLESAAGRHLRAVHPRFPFQKATSPGTLPTTFGTKSVAVELLFGLPQVTSGGLAGLAPPALQISHEPLFPAAAETATLTVVALDDVEVTSILVTVDKVEELFGPLQINPSVVNVQPQTAAASPNPARKLQEFRVRCTTNAVRATLGVTATDSGGRATTVPYLIPFGGTPPGGVPTTPITPPRILRTIPAPGNVRVPSLTPVKVFFSEPMNSASLKSLNWISVDGQHRVLAVEPSADSRSATIIYDGDPVGPVSFTLGNSLQDQNSHDFDQDMLQTGKQTYPLTFEQSGVGSASISGITSGGGVVFQGAFAYALDRLAGGDGRVLAYRLTEELKMEEADDADIAGRPSDIALIGNYSLAVNVVASGGATSSQKCEQADLVAVFSGAATEPKRLTLVPIISGDQGDIFGDPVSGIISFSPASLVVKSKWDPPFLGFFELGGDVTSVGLINVNAFHTGYSSSDSNVEQFPEIPFEGLDKNFDGDFCDSQDIAPLPSRDRFQVFGLSFSYAPSDPNERIADFDFDSDLGMLVTVFTGTGGVVPGLRTVLGGAGFDILPNSIVQFSSADQPKRVLLLPGTRLSVSGSGTTQLKDIALVSFAAASGGDGFLRVVDLTDPNAPLLLNRISLPSGDGSGNTMQKRPDGLVVLATSSKLRLLDPTRLLDPPGPQGHPAFVGTIDGIGGGVRSYVSDISGINIVNAGTQQQLIQTAPHFQVVTFPGDSALPLKTAKEISTLSGPEIDRYLNAARPVTIAQAANFPVTGALPDPDPRLHYYVIVRAPGAAAKELDLAVAAIDARGGRPISATANALPVLLADPSVDGLYQALALLDWGRSTLAQLDEVVEVVAKPSLLGKLRAVANGVISIKQGWEKVIGFFFSSEEYPSSIGAFRLAADTDLVSDRYNTYLAGPIVLQTRQMTNRLDELQSQLERHYLRATPAFWVGLGMGRALNLASLPNPSDLFGVPAVPIHITTLDQRDNPIVGRFTSDLAMKYKLLSGAGSTPGVVQFISDLGPALIKAATKFFTGNFEEGVVELVDLIAVNGEPVLQPSAHALVPVSFSVRPLVFVPGVMGSELHGNINPLGHWILGQPFDIVEPQLLPLDLNAAGESEADINPSDVTRVIGGMARIYAPLLEFLTSDLGYVEYDFKTAANTALTPVPLLPGEFHKRRRLTGPNADPNLSQDPVPTLFVYPYDWRRDNAISAQGLKEYVDLIQAIHPDVDKVDIIAHSMGGLVSRRFMLDHPELVNRFISISTPWLGAAKLLQAARTGDMDEVTMQIFLPSKRVRRILRFMPAPHQLAPAKGLFDLGLMPMFEAGWDINTNGIAYERYAYGNYANVYENHFLQEVMDEFPSSAGTNSPGLGFHESLHLASGEAISDWRSDTLDVNYFHIFSMQSIPQTPGRIALTTRIIPRQPLSNDVTLELPPVELREGDDAGGEDRPDLQNNQARLPLGPQQFKMVRAAEMIRTAGDQTVPILSLTRGAGSSGNRNSPRAKLIPIVSASPETDELAQHNGIIGNPRVHDVVQQILEDRTPEVAQVSIQVSPASPREGDEVEFSISFSTPESAQGPPTLVVDFGDGGSALKGGLSGVNTTTKHVFLDDGNYTVTCGVSFTNGVAGLTSITVPVANAPPQAFIENGNIKVPLGASPILIGRAPDPGIQDQHRFEWDFNNDGTIDFDKGFVATPTFNTAGPVTVKLMVRDFDGGVNDTTINVEVGAPVPVVPPPETQPTNPPLVGGGPAHIFVNISGQDFTTTDGIKIESDDSTFWGVVQQQLIGRTFKTVLGNILRAIATYRTDHGSKENIYANVFRNFDSSGPTSTKTTITADGGDNILNMNVLYLEGGVPQRRFNFKGFLPSSGTAAMEFDWVAKTANMVSSSGIFESTILSNTAAADRSGPSLALIQNLRTDRIFIIGRDNFTPEKSLRYFIGEDADGNGDFGGETFFQLTNHHFLEIASPSRRYLIVGVDDAGNVSDLTTCRPGKSFDVDFQYVPNGAPAQTFEKSFCDELADIRSAVGLAIQDGLASAEIQAFLIHEDDIWFFEQGSGACLWKGGSAASCDSCKGVYKPGKSDNDYELFMPVFKPPRFATRSEFVAADPHSTENMEGNWYFKTPEGLDGSGQPVSEIFINQGINPAIHAWRYTLPSPFLSLAGFAEITMTRPSSPTANPANPFFFPITPAQAIAFFFTRTVTNNPAFREFLPEVSFFPFRREHFEFAFMSLEKPPPFGDDPVGDAGMGRHLLLIKWLLEGAYLNLPAPLNDNIKDVNVIFAELTNPANAPNGIPAAEGYEWGIYQDWAALKSGARLRVEKVDSNPTPAGFACLPTDSLRKEDEKIIKKVGKAGIRATLAMLATDPQTAARVLATTPAQYNNSGYSSFEHYIADLATNAPGSGLFSGQTSLISDFLRAKVADEAFMDELIDNKRVQQFLDDSFDFMRIDVQLRTKTAFDQYLGALETEGRRSEKAARELNLRQIEFGFDAGGKRVPGRRQLLGESGGEDMTRTLTVAVHNRGPNPAGGGSIEFSGGGGPTPGPTAQDLAFPAAIAASSDDAFQNTLVIPLDPIDPNDRSKFITVQPSGSKQIMIVENSSSSAARNGQINVLSTVQGNEHFPANDRMQLDIRMLPNNFTPPIAIGNNVTLKLLVRVPGATHDFVDYPQTGNRPRGPKFRLSSKDEIVAEVTGNQNSSFQVKVQSQSDTAGIITDLTPVVQGKFVSAPPNHRIHLDVASQTPSSSDPAKIKVIDEEILTFTVLENGAPVGNSVTVMADRGEMASASLQFLNHPTESGLRDLVHRAFTTGTSQFQFDYFENGNQAFADMFLPAPLHPIRPFIQNFGANPDEADILFSWTHGENSGGLMDHDVNTDEGANVILRPENDLASLGLWNSDADVAMLYACSLLDDDIVLNGFDNWSAVMRGNARPVRLILGFRRKVGFIQLELEEFLRLVGETETFIAAWERSMLRNDSGMQPRPYAIAVFESGTLKLSETENRFRIAPPPIPGEPILYFHAGNPANLSCFFLGNATKESKVSPSAPGPERPSSSPIPASLPGQVELTPVSILSQLKLPQGRYEKRGRSESLSRPSPRVSLTPTPLTSEGAARMTSGVLSNALARVGKPIDLRVSAVSPLSVGRSEPNKPVTTVTNGFVVFFEHYWQGVPVLEDGISVHIAGTNIVRICGSTHVPQTTPTITNREILSPVDALRHSGQQSDAAVANLNSKLMFVSLAKFDPSAQNSATYVPAWKFERRSRRVPGAPYNLWVNAVTGEFLGETLE